MNTIQPLSTTSASAGGSSVSNELEKLRQMWDQARTASGGSTQMNWHQTVQHFRQSKAGGSSSSDAFSQLQSLLNPGSSAATNVIAQGGTTVQPPSANTNTIINQQVSPPQTNVVLGNGGLTVQPPSANTNTIINQQVSPPQTNVILGNGGLTVQPPSANTNTIIDRQLGAPQTNVVLGNGGLTVQPPSANTNTIIDGTGLHSHTNVAMGRGVGVPKSGGVGFDGDGDGSGVSSAADAKSVPSNLQQFLQAFGGSSSNPSSS